MDVGNTPVGYPIPFRPTDSPGRARLAEFRRPQPAEKNSIRFLPGHVPGKKLFSPRECRLRRRGSGCIPQFWEPSAAGPKIPAFPSPPSRWAGRYGRKIQGRRPGKKEGAPPQGPPNQKRWVQGGRTSSSLVFFPPAFFQRKPGSPAGVGGGGIPPLPEPTQHGRGLPHPGGLLLHHRRHPGGLLGGHCRAVYLPERRYPLPHPAGHDPLCPPGGL